MILESIPDLAVRGASQNFWVNISPYLPDHGWEAWYFVYRNFLMSKVSILALDVVLEAFGDTLAPHLAAMAAAQPGQKGKVGHREQCQERGIHRHASIAA